MPIAKDDPTVSPLNWGHDVQDVPASGLDVERSASEEECRALARALNVLEWSAVRVRYRIRRAPAACYRMTGTATADVLQSCVITLSPVQDTIVAPLDVEFQPPEHLSTKVVGGLAFDDAYEVEPIEGTWLAVGRIVFEELAAGLDPYPRKPGAVYVAPTGESRPQSSNPFTALAKLKPPEGDPK